MHKADFSKQQARNYPLDDINYSQFTPQKQSIVQKLCYLFCFYSAKASKHAYHELPEHYFMEMITDLWESKGKQLSKNKGEWKELQMLYHSKGIKNCMSFQSFLEVVPVLAIYSEPDLPPEEALKSIMHYFISLYEHKVEPEISGKVINVDLMIEEETRQFLRKLSSDLTRLYKLYFSHEVNQKGRVKSQKALSMESFIEFLKDFEVFPKLISARDVFYIFNEGCESGLSDLVYQTQDFRSVFVEMGENFKLSKFVESLIIISKRAFSRLKQVENEEDWQKQQKYVLRTLLEYMQTVKTSSRKKAKYSSSRFCFIVLEEHPDQQQIKTIQVKDKTIRESMSNMDFFCLMDKLTL